MIVSLTTVFPLSKILSHFVRKPRFNLHQNCVTNSIYTSTQGGIPNPNSYCGLRGTALLHKEILRQELTLNYVFKLPTLIHNIQAQETDSISDTPG